MMKKKKKKRNGNEYKSSETSRCTSGRMDHLSTDFGYKYKLFLKLLALLYVFKAYLANTIHKSKYNRLSTGFWTLVLFL